LKKKYGEGGAHYRIGEAVVLGSKSGTIVRSLVVGAGQKAPEEDEEGVEALERCELTRKKNHAEPQNFNRCGGEGVWA
jgi:hypothetical protein